MKCKKFIAIATAAAFAVTGTAYGETGENLATEGSDVTAVIEDISLMGDRIEADDTAYYTGDVTVNYSLFDETGISSVAIVVNGETLAEKKYDTSNCIETADGEVMNAESTIETEGADAQANTSEPITTVSDSLVISADNIKELDAAKAAEEEAEAKATEPTAEATSEEATESNAEAVTEPDAATQEADAVTPETAATPEAGDAAAAPTDANATAPAEEATSEEATEPTEPTEAAAEATEPAEEPADDPTENTYTAEMVVTDVNGNVEKKEFDFNAAIAETPAEEQEEVAELKAAGVNQVQVIDATTFRVEVNLTCQVVTIYKKNTAGTYEPIRVSVCSTARKGCNTPVGTWTIGPSGTKCARSRWALMSSGSSYAQYLVRFKGGKCFHSIIYKERGNNAKMYRKEYNKLGTVASAGCVRLRAIDAKWIYDHCPNGTKVRVYKDSIASPLGVPTYQKLGGSNTYSWDPTDPDTGNPFRGGSGKATGIYVAFDDGLPVITMDPNIANHIVDLSDSKYTYNGKVHKPSVHIYGLSKGTNFTVAYPSGCKKVGTYVVTITGKGSFNGTKKVSFQIVPKKTSIKSLKRSGSMKFKVKYKKITKQISGYEIMYSTNSSFKDSKTTKAKGYKKTSKTVKVPTKGKYYVKVRVYKTVGKTTYYGSWSKSKKVTVK